MRGSGQRRLTARGLGNDTYVIRLVLLKTLEHNGCLIRHGKLAAVEIHAIVQLAAHGIGRYGPAQLSLAVLLGRFHLDIGRCARSLLGSNRKRGEAILDCLGRGATSAVECNNAHVVCRIGIKTGEMRIRSGDRDFLRGTSGTCRTSRRIRNAVRGSALNGIPKDHSGLRINSGKPQLRIGGDLGERQLGGLKSPGGRGQIIRSLLDLLCRGVSVVHDIESGLERLVERLPGSCGVRILHLARIILDGFLQGCLIRNGVWSYNLKVVDICAGLAITGNGGKLERMLAVLKTRLLEDLGHGGIGTVLAQGNAIELLAIELNVKGAAAKVFVRIGLNTRAVKRDTHARTGACLGLGTAVMLVGLAAPRAPRTIPRKSGVRVRLIDGVLDDAGSLACDGKRDVARTGNTGGTLCAGLDLDNATGALDGQQSILIDSRSSVTALGAHRPRHIGGGCVGGGDLGNHLKGRTALRQEVHAVCRRNGNFIHRNSVLVEDAEGVKLHLGTRGSLSTLLRRCAHGNGMNARLKVVLGEHGLLALRRGSIRINRLDDLAVDGNLERAAVVILAGNNLDARTGKHQRSRLGARGCIDELNGSGVVDRILVPVAPIALIDNAGVLVVNHAGHIAQVLDIGGGTQLTGSAVGNSANTI